MDRKDERYGEIRRWVPVRPGGRASVVLEVEPEARLLVEVKDAEGRPLPRFRVSLLAREAGGLSLTRHVDGEEGSVLVRGIPVVVLTATSQRQREAGEALEAAGVLVKPFHLEALFEVVRRFAGPAR